jgi:histidinol-phosphate aminotransferase
MTPACERAALRYLHWPAHAPSRESDLISMHTSSSRPSGPAHPERSLFRPDIDRIEGYTPGEQPQETGWIKLNTNENPYPPSPAVRSAVILATEGRLNIYPDPLATAFRKKAAALFGVDPDWVLPGNGSDECLTLITRAFVDRGELVTFPYPSYILYETLADLQGVRHDRLLLNADWSWNRDRTRPLVERSKLAFVPNPNSPSGNAWTRHEIEELIPPAGMLVLDGAYADFADNPDGGDVLRTQAGARVILTRTFSKSYSLAGVRFGFAMAHPDVIRGLRKVKDSYNCNTLSLAAALAAIDDQDWMRANVEKICGTRARLIQALRGEGFHVVDSQANFVWATQSEGGHREIYQRLKDRKILVRYMRFPDAADGAVVDGLRITVGTDEEVGGLLSALKEVLA